MTEDKNNQTTPMVVEQADDWDTYRAKLTAEEQGYADKVRLHEGMGALHLVSAHLYLGKLARSLMSRPKYSKKLIIKFAELRDVSTAVVYRAARLIERMPARIVEVLLRRADSGEPLGITINHLVAVMNLPAMPKEEEARHQWFEDHLARIVKEEIPARQVKARLAPDTQVSAKAAVEEAATSEPEQSGDKETKEAVSSPRVDDDTREAAGDGGDDAGGAPTSMDHFLEPLHSLTEEGERVNRELRQLERFIEQCAPADAAKAYVALNEAWKNDQKIRFARDQLVVKALHRLEAKGLSRKKKVDA